MYTSISVQRVVLDSMGPPVLLCGLGSQEILMCDALIRSTGPSIGGAGTEQKNIHTCIASNMVLYIFSKDAR